MNALILAHQPCEDCGSSDALAIYLGNTYCWSCHTSRQLKPTKAFKAQSKQNAANCETTTLPHDFETVYLPELARAWLYTVGIDEELQKKYQIGYSASWDRIIIPSYFKGQLLGWQGRAFKSGHEPKYIQAKGQKPLLFFSKSCETSHIPFLVIVEDAASAIHLGQYVPTVALLGTKLDSQGKQLVALSSLKKQFILWLDGDRAGREAARELEKRLDLVGLVLENRYTRSDPKYLTPNELQEIAAGFEAAWVLHEDEEGVTYDRG